MGIEWIIAGAIAHAPGAIQHNNRVKVANYKSARYQNIIDEYRIPIEIEDKIREEVANPENYEQIWETLEHFLRKNPRYLVGDHFNAWSCVGQKRLKLHLELPDTAYRNMPSVILKNRKIVEGLLAVVYGGHTLEQAEKIAHAIVYNDEIWRRSNGWWNSCFNERPPLFPDIDEPDEEEADPQPTVVGELWKNHAQTDNREEGYDGQQNR